jgi:subtilase family serine protease
LNAWRPPETLRLSPLTGYRGGRSRRAIAALCLLLAGAAVVTGCVRAPASRPLRSTAAGDSAPPTTLAEAISSSRLLGRTDRQREIRVTLTLRGRDPQGLSGLIAEGRTVTAAQFAARFGADPLLVRRALGQLESVGLHGEWRTGSQLATAAGPVRAVERYFGVELHDYQLPDGTRFHAADREPRIPQAIATVVSGVTGLDDFSHYQTHAIRPGGLTPLDIRTVYGIDSLTSRGLDGSGQTIVLPEIDDLPNLADLAAFARKFDLPPFDVTVKRDVRSWGRPQGQGKPGSEVTLDLEVIHAIAPRAKLVPYISSPQIDQTAAAFDALVSQNPGAIISDSIGACEAGLPSDVLQQGMESNDRAVAQGMSHFVAAGDRGAYDCGENRPPSVDFPSALPTVTSVGGTTIFQTPQGAYQKEAAWGNPISQAGTGGGLSQHFKRPAYQKGPGVANQFSNGNRQVPDVAAAADENSGYHIVLGGRDRQIGGTSAAAPVWAAVTALIDQDFQKRGLKPVGFANPALYWMGQNGSQLSRSPFHQVTEGNNLAYPAGPGWNYCTGLGSLQANALESAFEAYQRQGGA